MGLDALFLCFLNATVLALPGSSDIQVPSLLVGGWLVKEGKVREGEVMVVWLWQVSYAFVVFNGDLFIQYSNGSSLSWFVILVEYFVPVVPLGLGQGVDFFEYLFDPSLAGAVDVVGFVVVVHDVGPEKGWKAFHEVFPSNGILCLEYCFCLWCPGGVVGEWLVVSPICEPRG